MKYYNMSAFSVPVTISSFDKEAKSLNSALLADVFHYMETHHSHLDRSGVGVVQTEFGLEKTYKSFEVLAKTIGQFAEPYIEWTGVKTNKIDVHDFWANVNQSPYAFHMPHSHTVRTALFTGVYFPTSGIENGVEIEEKSFEPEFSSKGQPDPGSLVLLDPLEAFKTSVATTKTAKYPFFGNPIQVKPKASTIVLFPSYLSHLVVPTQKENFTRVSIAFNIQVDG